MSQAFFLFVEKQELQATYNKEIKTQQLNNKTLI